MYSLQDLKANNESSQGEFERACGQMTSEFLDDIYRKTIVLGQTSDREDMSSILMFACNAIEKFYIQKLEKEQEESVA